jgi:hypothetical protein
LLLSVGPVTNLLSSHQAMNSSFDPLELVNTYGAFGSVGSIRREIVFEGTDEDTLTDHTVWREYQFKVKPGDPRRRPSFISPYHYRLDWLMWFAAMGQAREYPWTIQLVRKLLHNDPDTLGLLAGNPFPASPPRFIRAQLYRYSFVPPGDKEGGWWLRTLEGSWLPPLTLASRDAKR